MWFKTSLFSGLVLGLTSIAAQDQAAPGAPKASDNIAVPPAEQTSSPVVAPANISTPGSLRQITLAEAIAMAVRQNYDVQITRYTPEISGYDLAASYAVYEPGLAFSGTHSERTSPGGKDRAGLPLPNEEQKRDDFGGSLGVGPQGYLPSGLTYGVSANVSHAVFDRAGSGTNAAVHTEQFSSGWGIDLRQPLLRDFWIDQSRLTIKVSKKNLEISEWQLRRQLIDTIADVEDAYYTLIFTRESIRVQRTALDLANQLLRENKKRVEVGALAPLDEKQAESEVARNLAALIEAEQNYAIQQNVLKNLITDEYAKLADVTLDPMETLVAVPAASDLAESWRRGLTMRPDLQQLKLELEKSDLSLRFLKNQLWPSLDLTGSYGVNHLEPSYGRAVRALTHDDNPAYSYGVVLTVPLGNIRARNNYKAGIAEKQQSLLRYKQLEQLIMVQIDNAIKQLRSEFQKVEATRQARLFAQDALAAEQKKLENGKSTSFLVLQFQRDLTQRRFEEIQALANYNRALSALSQQEGATLERHNLTVNLK